MTPADVRDVFALVLRESAQDSSWPIAISLVQDELALDPGTVEAVVHYLESRGVIRRSEKVMFITGQGEEIARTNQDVATLDEANPKATSEYAAARPSDPLLDLTGPKGERATVRLGKAEIIAGRSPQADLRLNDLRASKKHCSVGLVGGRRYLLKDLGSANGTMVNGQTVKQRILTHGDEIQVGESRIVFRCPPYFDTKLA